MSLNNKIRIIPRIDIKNEMLIKGVQLEGLRVLGRPLDFIRKYYKEEADEIILMDAVASLYDRNGLEGFVKKLSKEIFIPISTGGGIRNSQDVYNALVSGADKVTINTAAIKNINTVINMAREFGSQAIVGSVEVKKVNDEYRCFYDNGREISKYRLNDWLLTLENAGIGEILLTSVDQEGTCRGPDKRLIEEALSITNRPLIYCGGIGNIEHVKTLVENYGNELSGISLASILHYNHSNISEIKKILKQ